MAALSLFLNVDALKTIDVFQKVDLFRLVCLHKQNLLPSQIYVLIYF